MVIIYSWTHVGFFKKDKGDFILKEPNRTNTTEYKSIEAFTNALKKSFYIFFGKKAHAFTFGIFIYQRAGTLLKIRPTSTQLVRKILSMRAPDAPEIDLQDDYKISSMAMAAAIGDANTVRALLDCKANPLLEIDEIKSNPIELAVREGYISTLEVFANEYKYSLNTCYPGTGYASIHRAAISNHSDVIYWLVNEQKVNVDLEDNNGYTALMYAAEYGRVDSATMLLKCNATFHPHVAKIAVDNKHLSIFEVLLKHNPEHFVEQILEVEDFNKIDPLSQKAILINQEIIATAFIQFVKKIPFPDERRLLVRNILLQKNALGVLLTCHPDHPPKRKSGYQPRVFKQPASSVITRILRELAPDLKTQIINDSKEQITKPRI